MIKRIKLRTLALGGLVTLLFLFLVIHLYKTQIVNGAQWLAMAEQRWSTSETFPAKRGTITDRNGNVLAMDALAYNVSINPTLIHKLEVEDEVTNGLVTILEADKAYISEQINATRDDGSYYSNRELRKGGWQIEKTVADQLKAFSDELKKKLISAKKGADTGIYITETYERLYPRHKLASQIIGYTSLDGENKMGLEATFDDLLHGENGYISYKKDGQRVQILGSDVEYVAPKDGQLLQLTIDNDIQDYAEEALREVVRKYSPKSATAIVANPKTMEILAMANLPDFDPNEYWKSAGDYSAMYNHAVGSLYEPGSTFKIATLAAAIEEGVFDPEEIYQSGSITVSGDPTPIRDHNRVGWGKISFMDGLKYSSNVAFVKLGYERLGGDKLRDYFTNFGFGQKTGIEVSNEATGTIRFQYPRDIAAATFGQGVVLVTPIQQVAAVAAVANGGQLMKPYLVKSITDPLTKTTTVTEPTVVRRVISEQASKLAGEYLEQVVSDQVKGTGRNAYIEGYRVAGKTGTAQKVGSNGKYSSDKFVVSFIGYAPVEDPQLIVYVIIDEPNDPLAGGGAVAAPVFREILLKSLRKLEIAPSYMTTADEKQEEAVSVEAMIQTPDVTGMKGALAKEKLKVAGLNHEFVGEGKIIEQQIPPAGSLVHPTQKIYLITEQKENLVVPDLTGASLRDAVEITALLGVKLKVEGSGYIYEQELAESGGKRTLTIKMQPLADSEYSQASPLNHQESTEDGQAETGDSEGEDTATGDQADGGENSEGSEDQQNDGEASSSSADEATDDALADAASE